MVVMLRLRMKTMEKNSNNNVAEDEVRILREGAKSAQEKLDEVRKVRKACSVRLRLTLVCLRK